MKRENETAIDLQLLGFNSHGILQNLSDLIALKIPEKK